jgi:coenzyme F420-reducing hydrogenase alpha subunit
VGNLDIRVEHITRVEGHGNVSVRVRDGRLESARFEIVESPRFFEVMLQGRDYLEAAPISSRICGICAVAHTTASLRATEDAFGVKPSGRTQLLRKLIYMGEVIQSHILHVYFLAAPDMFGVGSVVPLLSTHAGVVKRALKLKRLGNDICETVGGRHVHPVSMTVGGFTKYPDDDELTALHEKIAGALPDMDETVKLIAGMGLPVFERETEYLSLKGVDEYPFISGDIVSSSGPETTNVREYRSLISESVVEGSTAKHAVTARGPYMVGALARFNNNHELLSPRAKEAAERLGLSAPCHNPFMINAAQVVETVHCMDEAVSVIDRLAAADYAGDEPAVRPAEGRGVGVVEAPRGLLVHELEYGADGKVAGANCIIPTGQNLANIEADMQNLIPELAGKAEEEITRLLQMLVRAYDPCISCSTHSIGVEFV